MSSLIDAQTRKELEKLFTNLAGQVRITLFTQSKPCPACIEQRKLLEDIASTNPKISLTIFDFVKDNILAKSRGADKIPATLVDGEKEYNVIKLNDIGHLRDFKSNLYYHAL